MKDQRNLIAIVVVLVGVIAVAVGVIYMAVDARSLPSILGPVHGYSGHRWKRGLAVFVVGVLLLGGAGTLGRRTRRSVN